MRYADKERNAVILILHVMGFAAREISHVCHVCPRRVDQIIAGKWGPRKTMPKRKKTAV